ncbi:Autophagy protein 22 [Pichia californica]|nr:Autophagy protein 22 [[Candida] californica]
MIKTHPVVGHLSKVNVILENISKKTHLTKLQILLFAIFPLIILLGQMMSLLSPDETIHNYFTSGGNLINKYFVKQGWFWTLVTYFNMVYNGIQKRIIQKKTILISVLRVLLITLGWLLFTQWCFGPPLMDRIFLLTGGHCSNVQQSSIPTSLEKLFQRVSLNSEDISNIFNSNCISSSSCRRLKGSWEGGHDPSGHVFLLTLSCCLLVLETIELYSEDNTLQELLNKNISILQVIIHPIMVTTLVVIGSLMAWALIGLAAEPYVVSVLGTYTPILLEQLARENGVLASDHLTPCIFKDPGNTPIPNPPPPNQINSESTACVLPILSKRFYIDTSSYALYTFSFSVLLQTVFVLTISGIADNSNYKKKLILLFGLLGGFTTSLFFFLGSHNYYAASFLAIIANCSFGCVNVLMNSYLTMLIQNYPFQSLQENEGNTINSELTADDETALIGDSELGRIGSRISGIGTSTGYISALLIQICALFSLIFLKTINNDIVWCIKIIISSIGVWWFCWQLPIALYLRNITNGSTNWHNNMKITTMIKRGYADLVHALYKIKDLKDIYFFLLGWFVLSDSITTINSTAILFAKTNLHMPMISLGKIGVLVMISAISGSIIIPHVIIGYFKCNLQQVLVGLVVWCLCVPLYGIFALNSAYEMYILAIWYGIGLGGLSTVSRSIYSIIIPKGKENVFFSIFSLTDKTSSIIGPFVVGLIVNVFHELRGAFWVLALLLIISFPILFNKFNLSRARDEADAFI